jgi:hypothetical protein
MDASISGRLTNAVTGEILLLPILSLTLDGIPGETRTQVTEDGHFAFTSLPAGDYCLGVHDDRYAPLYHHLTPARGRDP